MKKLLEPDTVFDIDRIRDLSELNEAYDLDLALLTNSYCIPIENDNDDGGENRRFRVKHTMFGNILLIL